MEWILHVQLIYVINLWEPASLALIVPQVSAKLQERCRDDCVYLSSNNALLVYLGATGLVYRLS